MQEVVGDFGRVRGCKVNESATSLIVTMNSPEPTWPCPSAAELEP